MSTAEKVLLDVNDILANKGRWSPETLLSLLSAAQRKIARRTEVLKKTTVLNLVENQAVYRLDNFAYRIYRVLYNNTVLDIRTREFADSYIGPDWESHQGKNAQLIITNLQELPSLRVYPVPSGGPYIIEGMGVATDVEVDGPSFNSPYGVLTSIDLPDLPPSGETLLIYHSYVTADIVDPCANLELNFMYDDALVHLTAGMALRQNEDFQNRSFANEEFMLYEAEMRTIMRDGARGSEADASAYSVTYRGGFNS